jgi:3D (Asp-Asp-Asp) domain-containing protein
MEKESKEEKNVLKKDVQFTFKMEGLVYVEKEGKFRFEWGFKNIQSDQLREMFVLLLLDSIATDYVDGFNRIQKEGSPAQKKAADMDQSLFRSMILMKHHIQERLWKFIYWAAERAIGKQLKGNNIDIYGVTAQDLKKYGKKQG